MKKLILIFVTILTTLTTQLNSQIFVNRVYQEVSANPVFNPVLNPFGINWSKSITNANNELITVGHTTVSGQGENLFLEKRNSTGGVIFSVNKNTTGSNNDYGVSLIEASLGGDIYVCGATDNGSSSDYDIIIYRYNSSGVLQDSAQFDGGSNLNDIPSCLTIDGSGNVLIGGSSEVSTASYDYLLLKYSSSLSFINSNNYDYTGLNDIAIGIEINSSNGDISLIGASASSSATAEYAVAVFVGTSLSYLSDERSSIPGTALDEPLAYCKDASNNVYITGKAWNGSNFDVKTIKISSTYSLSWSAPIDLHGFDDGGTAISVDPVSGDIIVGGYATKSNSIKELICLRLNASTGTVITNHHQSSENTSGDAFVKALTTNTLGDVYFIGEEKGNSGKRQTLIGKIKSNGQQSWQRKVLSNNYAMKASDIELSSDGVSIISILDSTVTKYVTTKFSEFELDTDAVYRSTGKPIFKKNELIVRFMPTVLDSDAIDNKIGTANKTFANLNYFLESTPYSQFVNAIGDACPECPIKALKVFPYLTTTFTTTTSRLGQNVAVPDFWATLLLQFPSGTDIHQVSQNLEGIPNVVAYSHPNFIATLPQVSVSAAGPSTIASATDPFYSYQHSLHNFGLYPNADINIDDAWGIVQSGGNSFVKGGVMDSGIEWRHEDFGYFPSIPNSSKIVDGWDFISGTNLRSMSNPDFLGHGTAVAGIIGAVKGNTLGIKGIAGGDFYGGNNGVSLYSLAFFRLPTNTITLNYIADGIINSALTNTNTSYGYGLHFQNNSWTFDSISSSAHYIDTNIVLLTEAVHFVNRQGVTFVMGRGNEGTNSSSLPATLHDDWVLTVGGTGTDGNYMNGTNGGIALSYGKGVDIAAPSSNSLILTTWRPAPLTNTTYNSFDRTSAAAPHVSGVVGLLMSYHNNPSNPDDYNNLAPEDCEEIIQRSASTPTTPGVTVPNQFIGHGRLNAGKALKMIESTYRTLYHFGTNTLSPYTFTKSVYSSSDTVRLMENFMSPITSTQNLYRGKYVVKTFEINATVNHGINSSTDSLMFYWARPSSSFVYPLFNNTTKQLYPREKVIITSMNSTAASLKGYVYKVSDTLGNFAGWIPCDTSFSALYTGLYPKSTLMEYTILTKNIGLSVKQNMREMQQINLFPNPSSNKQTIEIVAKKESTCTIELFDIMGRLIKSVYIGRLETGKNEILNDITKLPNSMYIYYIKIDGNIYYKKFIKE